MRSRDTISRMASSRSQSHTRRCTSASGLRLRSARGGKSLPRSSPQAPPLPLLILLPDQKAVRQHHAYRVPMKTRPQPPLVLVPTQEPLRLLVELLHPVSAMRVLHHLLQRHLPPEVAPPGPPLAVGTVLTDQPTDAASAIG